METTTCCIAGGGPAGMMLGLLLARAGIEVVVLEKHGDFLRDFRGDTVHPSTLDVLDDLGLSERFEKLEHHKVTGIAVITDDGEIELPEVFAVKGSQHPYLAMVPQWDLLDLLAQEASRLPNFRLLMNAEAVDLAREGNRVTGVRYRTDAGEETIRAQLTVAADGRKSVLRARAMLPIREYGSPMDVVWVRVPMVASDRSDSFMRLSAGHLMIAINRTAYWQLAYVVPKGRASGLPAEELRRTISRLIPFMAGRVDRIEVGGNAVLSVRIDRLRRWYRSGFLCIGDAAHAMSPIGGVGINLAVQDAVAVANLLYEPLRRGQVQDADLAAVQRRRMLPTVLVQGFQRVAQRMVIEPALRGRPIHPPKGLPWLRRVPAVRQVMARMAAYGPRPERPRTELHA